MILNALKYNQKGKYFKIVAENACATMKKRLCRAQINVIESPEDFQSKCTF